MHSKNKNRVPPSEAEATPQTDEHRSQPVEASEQTRTLSEQQGEGTVSGSGDATCEPAAEVNEVEALQAERDKIKDQLVRTAADFDNFRKRSRRDIEEAKRRGKEEAIRDLLPVFDSLERAIAAARDAKDIQSIAEGVNMVLKLFEDSGERMGLKRLAAIGERFDPALHDAIQEMETGEVAPGTILAEVVPGYRLGEHLLRAAVVVVARAPRASGRTDGSKPAAPPEKVPKESSEEGVS